MYLAMHVDSLDVAIAIVDLAVAEVMADLIVVIADLAAVIADLVASADFAASDLVASDLAAPDLVASADLIIAHLVAAITYFLVIALVEVPWVATVSVIVPATESVLAGWAAVKRMAVE